MRLRAPHPHDGHERRSPADGGATRCRSRRAQAGLRPGDAPLCLLAGGETTVTIRGSGKGGRNQEMALAATLELADDRGIDLICVGTDGTDGPTDAAGGYCDGESRAALAAQGISIPDVLQQNDAYHALKKCDGLILTGPTGTNVNDLSVLLIPQIRPALLTSAPFSV